ncbi:MULTISPECIES: YbfB/YjiJ family MFS transporter [unclassified Pseudomonas]|uniref:YbfB/YjiJ family MFS transporter n=1 Tax=unclassified Pseudomonas TaxID=196821 RepID=UPI000BCEEF72|nr:MULTISPECIES: YbfB/YjiJ family MFS transporter [unclassified Pseudomonas]PVZ20505.1 putative MFS family arabinose efflux permease [Pseudomonas sp. URIL14HWK12:I12]PVZ27571.1 putative MFS family arabinose efflux permease [Pseudomonas sp. URIL14HWK12:I10]PVZ38460.1 putative MFS family arabinose efflux permease [Pseudomonas sp. URIL14HWK12:I11]SNZ03268.1 Predicted arabinose efflux permease, MFS family [Pseudomonas sp. URIL14HWK12:I9]
MSRDLRSAIAAALVMAVAMGFGRFAFTGLYPVMVREGVISVSDGSLAASANYLGYLLGALVAARLSAARAHGWVLAGLAATVLGLAALAVAGTPWLVIAVRGVAGAFSALGMIAASLWLLQHRGHAQGAPVLYAGVGFGVALSAELLALGEWARLGPFGLWWLLAGAAMVLSLASLPWLHASPVEPVAAPARPGAPVPLVAWRLIGLYGLAGLGYIVTATYLPLLIEGALGTANPVHAWTVFGLGAAPSCLLWHRLHERLGTRRALALNLTVQGVGVLLPALGQAPLVYLASALMVGATFMGTVTIALPAARLVAGSSRLNMMAVMTAAYGVGQIAGPLLAGWLYARSHSFALSLVLAASALWLAALLAEPLRSFSEPTGAPVDER